MTSLVWICEAPDGSTVILGQHEYPEGGEGGIFYIASSRELARSWARDLRAGRIPSKAEPDPVPDESPSDQTVPEPEPGLGPLEPASSSPPARSS